MPTILHRGNGVQTRFECPGSFGKLVYVNGVLTAPASSDFQSVTLTVAPGNKVAVQIDYSHERTAQGPTTGVLSAAPSAAFTVPDGISWLILAGSGTVPVKFPLLPQDNQTLTISLQTAHTAVTVVANSGQTVIASAALGVGIGAFGVWRYRDANASWYRVG